MKQDGGDEPPRSLIKSVDQAMRVLLRLQTERTLRVTDVARELDIARSSAHRLLSTLAWREFVSQDRATRSYRTGRVLAQIGLATIRDLDVGRASRHHLQQVAARTRETVELLVLEGGDSLFIDGVESDRPLKAAARTGGLLPAYTTAGGKALLADHTADELAAIYPGDLSRVTRETEQDLAALGAQLAQVRERGFALTVDEPEIGFEAVAVAIRDRSGRIVAAIEVSAPAVRMTPRDVPRVVGILADAAALIGDDPR